MTVARSHARAYARASLLWCLAAGYIVTVDDDVDLRELKAYQLRRAGYEVATAGDGPRALALIGRRLPDAVVLDASMPGMSGVEVCRNIRSMDVVAAVLIIMLGARTEVMSEMDGRVAGADVYLAKPHQSRTLLATIEDLLGT